MKQNNYEIEKNIEKIKNGSYTGFLTKNISLEIKRKLKRKDYQEFIPFKEAEKTILYTNTPPNVKLFRIDCFQKLRHSSILGSLFALNITSEVFGDIILHEENYYVYLLDSISDLIKNELNTIDKYPIKLVEVNLDTLSNYERKYEKIELIVSSLRLDTIISKLIGTNREKIQTLIKDNSILLNYEIIKKPEHLLKENDIFSIKGYGKYHFKQIIGTTKKENYIILIEKYI